MTTSQQPAELPAEPSPVSWTARSDEYVQLARQIAGVSVITTKQGRFWRTVAWTLFFISLGRFARTQFLTRFASTLGPIQAYPHDWEELSPRLIVHEARHTRQFLMAGWFVPVLGWLGPKVRVWAGMLPMMLIYGCFPLPAFFAWGRYRLELDADSFSWKAALENGWMTPEEVRARAISFAETISSWSYLKTWPEKWTVAAFSRRAEEVIAEWQATVPTVAN